MPWPRILIIQAFFLSRFRLVPSHIPRDSAHPSMPAPGPPGSRSPTGVTIGAAIAPFPTSGAPTEPGLLRTSFRGRILAESGIQEINIISQDTSRYTDPDQPGMDLIRLLDEIERLDGPRWIRLLYLHPATTSPALIQRMLSGGKVLPYFDLPVQSLVDSTLARMKRRTTWADVSRLVETIRSKNSQATIRSTLITGYPGETPKDHALTIERLQQLSFDKLGAFVWSPEEGTPAASERPRVTEATANRRLDEIMRTQQEISSRLLARYIGKTLPILVTGSTLDPESIPPEGLPLDPSAPSCWGRGPADAPDVDGLACATIPAGKPVPKPGSFAEIRIESSTEYDLYGALA